MTIRCKEGHTPRITARRVPEMLTDFHNLKKPLDETLARVILCYVDDGTQVLYLSSKRDDLLDALNGRKQRSDGSWSPGGRWFYLVLWGDRPVWLSSEECTLEACE